MRSRSCTPRRSPCAHELDDVAVAVLGHRAAEAVLRVVGHREQCHVGAVAGPEDREPLAVDEVDRAQEIGGGQAVAGVLDAPDAVVRALELPPVAGGAAEVDRQPGVALVDEVLRVAVPFVAVVGGRTAVGVDDRRHGPLGRRAGGAQQEGRDLQPVEGRGSSHPRARRAGPGAPRAEPARATCASRRAPTIRSSGGGPWLS